MRFPYVRRLGAGLAALALAAGVAACSSGSSSSGTSASGASATSGTSGTTGTPEMTNVKVGILSASDDAPVLLAIKQGFFKQQGLNVSYTIMPSTNASTALLQSHTIQFAIMNYVGMFQQEKAFPGLNLRIIADNVQTSPGLFDFMVAKNSKIKTLADLKGKKLSVPSAGVFSFPQLSLDVLGKPYGVNADSVTDVAIPFPAAPQALASGQVDAAFTTEPFITIMEQTTGAKVLVDMLSGPLAGFPVSAWGTTEYYTQQDPKTVAAFARAIQEATRYAAANPQSVRQVLPDYIKGMKPALASVIVLPTFNTSLSLARMQRVANAMESFGQLPASFVKTQVPAMYDPQT
jgi:NitT/TauT family transport system substrate-binding protein